MLAPSVIPLSQLPWRFGQASRQPFGPRPVDDWHSVTEWLPATVPGDVRADLLAAGRLRTLQTPEGIAASDWVDDADWWYGVTLPADLPRDAVFVLEADGIDYYSAVWLDRRLLATHAGMFSRQALTLSPWLHEPGSHELRMRVWGGGALPKEPSGMLVRGIRGLVSRFSPGTEFFPQRFLVPKAQFSFGWDFCPRVLSCGIWDDIRLVVARSAYIAGIQASATPLAETDPAPVRWCVRPSVHRHGTGPLSITITIAEPGGEPIFTSPRADLAASPPEIVFETPRLHLWWPWDQGEPRLYRVTVRLYDERGLADERSLTTGVRSVTRGRLSDGKPWRFTVNGRHGFLRGANWVPADILPGRVTPGDYRALLGMVRDAGINFLRVWGGGVREKQAFWDECDRLGILAWQEFPLACAFLDHYPRDAAYLHALQREARGTVRLLRNHPSLLAWCGGNEINPAREVAALQMLQRVLQEEDPDRPWIPSSPHIVEGDVHEWSVWHGHAPWTRLAERTDAFVSEFGMQALPDKATLNEMFAEVPPLSSPAWMTRKAQVAKLRHYGGPAVDADLEAAISATQTVQRAALQAGIEACRIRREPAAARRPGPLPPCGGVAFWQFNEPWPAVSWSVVDYSRRPKLAYRALREIYQPLLIAARFERRKYRAGDRLAADLWLVNDSPHTYTACTVAVRIDEVLVWQQGAITLEPGAAREAGRFEVRLAQPPRFLALSLSRDGALLASNGYDLQVYMTPPAGILSRLRRFLADWLVTG